MLARWIEALADLIWPPEEGGPPVALWRKALALVALALGLAAVAALTALR